jgi:hypothetical protein
VTIRGRIFLTSAKVRMEGPESELVIKEEERRSIIGRETMKKENY